MRLDRIHLKNYRCFKALSLDFHPQLTVLVAPNGQGKTTLLDAIKVALWPYLAGFDLGSTTNDVTSIQIDDVRREQVQSHEMEWRLPSEIKASGQLQVNQLILAGILKIPGYAAKNLVNNGVNELSEDVPWQCVRYRDKVKKGTKTKDLAIVDALNLNVTANALEKRIFSGDIKLPDDLPMLGYYGTGRLWTQKKLTAKHAQADAETQSRTFAYRDCLDPASSYKHFAEWFSRIHHSYLQAQIRNLEKRLPYDADIPDGLIAPFKAVQKAVDAILESHTGWHSLQYSVEYEELVLSHNTFGQLKVSQLSDGIRNMLALAGDMAYRCYKLNAHLGEAAPRQTQGVVLIDEVDMHLHPAWQQTVLPDLMAAFPKLQFVVTTHSPQVASSISSDSIRVISDGKIYATPPGAQGAESSRLLKRLFGVEVRPQNNVATQELKTYLELVYADKWDDAGAKALRQQLDNRYQDEEPALTEADLYIENRIWESSIDEKEGDPQ